MAAGDEIITYKEIITFIIIMGANGKDVIMNASSG
jgi:hypothetical protein